MDVWGKKVSKKNVEALAIAECMINNKKEKCFIYAINDETDHKLSVITTNKCDSL